MRRRQFITLIGGAAAAWPLAARAQQSAPMRFYWGAPPAVRPAQRATTTIPIVMGYSVDPVGNGFVATFANPDGNTTGLAGSSDDSPLQSSSNCLRP